MPSASPKTHTPICPKCGYDQSGTIATWKTQCPLQGTCPECGYQLEWSNIANPSHINYNWFVEHAQTNRQLLARTMPTLWYLLFPNRYWRRVKLNTPRFIKRYLISMVILLTSLHILTSILYIFSYYAGEYQLDVFVTGLWAAPQAQPAQASFFEFMKSTDIDYHVVNEALAAPFYVRGKFDLGYSSGIFGAGTVCICLSVTWIMVLFALQFVRSRLEFRFVHVANAMLVLGTVALLVAEFARLLEVVAYSLFHWTDLWVDLSFITNWIIPLFFISIFGLLIWTQWFLISAARIGWQLNSKWWELTLISFVSILSLPVSFSILFRLDMFEPAIFWVSKWIGM